MSADKDDMNVALQEAMAKQGLSVEGLARKAGLDPKTVVSALKDTTVPRPDTKKQIAEALKTPVGDFWPQAGGRSSDAKKELAGVWSHRSDAPSDLWADLLRASSERVYLLGYAIQFLHENHADFCKTLIDKANADIDVKIVLADPKSEHLAHRDAEEGLDGGLIARVQTSLTYFQELAGNEKVPLRLQDLPMYASVFVFDNDILWTPHQPHLPGRLVPLLHIRNDQKGLFDSLLKVFNRTFDISRKARAAFV